MVTEVSGDLWDIADKVKADAIAIPTNMCVKKNGRAVMGAGVALQALKRYPGMDEILGYRLKDKNGMKVCVIAGVQDDEGKCRWILSFPTKYDWRKPSSLKLIAESTNELEVECRARKLKTVVMTRPGCGLGGLKWDDVRPIIMGVFGTHETNIVVTSGVNKIEKA